MSEENKPPKKFVEFTNNYPGIAEAYSRLGEAVHREGPLDDRTRALIKVAISGGARMEGAFHAHVRKARMIGIDWDEIIHVALLTMPTIGFPNTIALLSWIDDVKKKE